MATSTLIQYLETERYGSLPGAGVEAVGPESMNRRQIETFIASGAITAGQTVVLNILETADGDKAIHVVPSNTGSDDTTCFVGVAITDASAAGDKVDVCVRGVCEATVKTAAAKGKLLYITSTAGVLDDVPGTAPATDSSPVAVALELRGAGTGLITVFVRGTF